MKISKFENAATVINLVICIVVPLVLSIGYSIHTFGAVNVIGFLLAHLVIYKLIDYPRHAWRYDNCETSSQSIKQFFARSAPALAFGFGMPLIWLAVSCDERGYIIPTSKNKKEIILKKLRGEDYRLLDKYMFED